MTELQPIVADIGSGSVKVGRSGAEYPSDFESIIALPKYPAICHRQKEIMVGNSFLGGVYRIKHPIEHGIIQHWDAFEELVNHMYYNVVRAAPEDHPLLMTEPVFNPHFQREKVTQIMFEQFHVPAFFLALSPILSVYASGRNTAMVVESGDGVTQMMPVTNGFTIKNCIRRIDLGGRDLTEYLGKLLTEQGHSFTTSMDQVILKSLKESVCYTPLDYNSELQKCKTGSIPRKPFKMPDDTVLDLESERFRVPEVMFDPSLIGRETAGIHEILFDAVSKGDMSYRKDLMGNIVLSGGNTKFVGFADRMQSELVMLAPSSLKIKIIAPVERAISAWHGGSILSSLSTFQQMWISREEYDENGPYYIHKKCISYI